MATNPSPNKSGSGMSDMIIRKMTDFEKKLDEAVARQNAVEAEIMDKLNQLQVAMSNAKSSNTEKRQKKETTTNSTPISKETKSPTNSMYWLKNQYKLDSEYVIKNFFTAEQVEAMKKYISSNKNPDRSGDALKHDEISFLWKQYVASDSGKELKEKIKKAFEAHKESQNKSNLTPAHKEE